MNVPTAYLTVESAQTYFDTKLDVGAWTNASSGDKGKALIQASAQVDLLAYVGSKRINSQEHEFPRIWADPLFDEYVYDTDNIPVYIKYAVCEQALALLDGFEPNKELNSVTVIRDKLSGADTMYDRDIVAAHTLSGLCPTAFNFLLPFLRDQRSITLARV